MFEALKRLYDEKRLDNVGLKRAVVFKWITTEQYQGITGEVYIA